MDGEISAFLQAELRRRALSEVPAVEAARWLDAAGLLKDSDSRPGKPLRDLLRAGRVAGTEQRPPISNGRWFIVLGGVPSSSSGVRDAGRAETGRASAPGVHALTRETAGAPPSEYTRPDLENAGFTGWQTFGELCSSPDRSSPTRRPGG